MVVKVSGFPWTSHGAAAGQKNQMFFILSNPRKFNSLRHKQLRDILCIQGCDFPQPAACQIERQTPRAGVLHPPAK